MAGADFSTPKRTRVSVIVLIVLLHVAVAFGLVRALAPDMVNSAVERVTSAVFVTVRTTSPTPSPEPPQPAPRASGQEGVSARKATPREETAPEPEVAIAEKPAPRAASTGPDNRSGANDAGPGTGAGDSGAGTGAGGSGSGQGGGGATRLEKIAGDINSTRDYPKQGRKERSGDSVTIQMSVGVDGRASNCRVVKASRDPEADRITCELAVQRFRFRPRSDASGNLFPGEYRWQQRWWDPRN
jgi:protein TonB